MLYLAVWAVLYGLSYFFARMVCPAAVPYVLICYACVLLAWLYFRHLWKTLRIKLPSGGKGRSAAVYAALLMMPAANLIAGGKFSGAEQVLLMLGTVSVEEIFFRGVLLGKDDERRRESLLLTKLSDPERVLFSAVLFAVLHAANALSGSGIQEVLFQIVCAFCAGILYGAATLWTDSLLPALIGHLLVNITAAETAVVSWTVSAGAALSLAAGILLICADKRNGKETD